MSLTVSSEVLLVERRGSIAWVTLNRPSKCNALDTELNAALIAACQSLTEEVAVVVLRGSGKHFCAGSDLKDLYQVDRREAKRVIQLEMDACHALASLPQLTVAVLQGKCYGGGAILPLYCDLRIGRTGVEFALPEVPLGWVPPYGIERLLANVPRGFAFEMLLSGRVCGDKEALEKSWLHRLTTSEEDESFYLEQLANIPRRTLADACTLIAPKNLNAMYEADERALAAFLNHFDTDQARATIAAFIERKRS